MTIDIYRDAAADTSALLSSWPEASNACSADHQASIFRLLRLIGSFSHAQRRLRHDARIADRPQ